MLKDIFFRIQIVKYPFHVQELLKELFAVATATARFGIKGLRTSCNSYDG